jgi:hypothetical protein
MARKKLPWFRFYTETVTDPKIRRLAPAHRWLWAVVLSAAAESPAPGLLLLSDRVPLSESDLADKAALPVRQVRDGIVAMSQVGLIEPVSVDGLPAEVWRVTRWDVRQYSSDTSTDRVRAHRKRSSNDQRNSDETFQGGSGNGDGNAPETDTETEPLSESDDHQPPSRAVAGVGGGPDQRVDQAIALEAERRLPLLGPPDNPRTKPASRLKGLRAAIAAEHRTDLELHAEAHPDWTPDQLANAIGTPPPRPPAAPCPTCDGARCGGRHVIELADGTVSRCADLVYDRPLPLASGAT